VDSFKEPPSNSGAVKKALTGEQVLQIEERGASQFIRLYAPFSGVVLVASYRMDPDIVQAQREVQDSFKEYEELKLFRHPLKSNFILTLTLFNLVSLFGAIWVAFFVAKQITGPIQRLAEGTQSVAKGDYDFRVDAVRDDEMGFLVTSFNSMLSELRQSRDEAERGRILIETILANLAVGVIGLDPQQRVTSVNSAAGALLQIDHIHFIPNTPLPELLRAEDYNHIEPMLAPLSAARGEGIAAVSDVEMNVECGGRVLQIVCTAGKVVSHGGELLGYVLLFDDITEISRAQHLAAWRDVARRIAHEIKNPLTPIQLSAQRLDKLLGDDASQAATVRECTRTIVEHVALIKRLANEFSEYGRMPTAQFSPTDLGALLLNSVSGFQGADSSLSITCDIEGKIPEMLLDPEQIRGAIINILKNSVDAVASNKGDKQVQVKASFDRSKRRAFIEIRDNGPGIPPVEKNRVFEPYYTTKKGGTGLGLAIVNTVISDHQGEIRLFDASPSGTKVIITLPQFPQPSTLRKLSPGNPQGKA
jgi:two-component system nitrogen regulation sensor histidine kinase NtrY